MREKKIAVKMICGKFCIRRKTSLISAKEFFVCTRNSKLRPLIKEKWIPVEAKDVIIVCDTRKGTMEIFSVESICETTVTTKLQFTCGMEMKELICSIC